MAITTREPVAAAQECGQLPPLENGDHLDQPTFHARYEAMPEGVRAELIGGIVFMASPVQRRHWRGSSLITRWLGRYEDCTPGTEAGAEGTVILGVGDEPEPDAFLRILPDYGGRTYLSDDYLTGAPEFVMEIAASSEAIDLHRKRDNYERAGVDEYVVLLPRSRQVRWLVLRGGRYELLPPGPDGIYRSQRFPGLWLDAEALFRGHRRRLWAVLDDGLASAEHQTWAEHLERSVGVTE